MIDAAADHRAWWLGMAGHLWQAGIVILGLWALERVLLRAAPARHRSALWTLALLALCVPAGVAGSALAAWLGPWLESGGGAGSVTVDGLRAVLRPELPGPETAPSRIWLLPTILWLAGATLLAVRLRRHRRAVATVGSSTEPVRGQRLVAAARRAGADPDRVVVTTGSCMPHVRGLLRPRIVVPAALVRCLEFEELAAVLAHEDAHVRRRDGLRRLAYAPVLLILWFFPLTWLVLRRLHGMAEMACDEAVLRRGFEQRTYARALARSLRLGLDWPAAAPALAGGADIRARLGNLRRREKEAHMKRHVLAIGLALLALATSVVVAAPRNAGLQQRTRLDAVLERHPELRRLRAVERVVDVEASGSLTRVLGLVAEAGDFEVEVDPDLAALTIRVTASDSTVGEVLATIAEGRSIAYAVLAPRRLVVIPIRGPVSIVRKGQEGPPYRVGGDIEVPEKIHHVSPEYPELARRAELGGVVILEAIVSQTGNVTDVHVLRGLGLGLDEAAITAVRQWRFSPTLVDGEPVEVLLTVTVHFGVPTDGP